MTDEKFADEWVVTAAELMTPDLANLVGNVPGCHVTRFADNLALVCADRVDFYEPVHIGELLLLTARVAYVHHSSMEIDAEVRAENIVSGDARLTNTCHFTFVALKDGKAFAVPRLVCRTREDKERYLRALMRRDMGLRYREEREGLAGQYDDLDEAALDALIAKAQTEAGQPAG
jgi:acyl-CoA hydrolase